MSPALVISEVCAVLGVVDVGIAGMDANEEKIAGEDMEDNTLGFNEIFFW